MARLAKRPWQAGDPKPEVGKFVTVSGANNDITSDQDRAYSERYVVGYSTCGNFVCLQTDGCWPTVERLENCWFPQSVDDRLIEAVRATAETGRYYADEQAPILKQELALRGLMVVETDGAPA